jgi:light-regulated signal transduction histidine kinase (bacteriophytochrome)
MMKTRSRGPGEESPAFGADITNCDREPIHSPGAVQPHGALLAVDPHDLQILQAGGDTPRIFGAEPSDLLTTNLSDWFAPDRVSQLRTLLDAEGPPMIRPVHAFAIAGSRDGGTVDTFVYRSGALVVLELEAVGESHPEDAPALVQAMLSRLQHADAPQDFCQGLAEAVRRVSGFDRVMVYRFLPDGTGCVDAEARGDGAEPFLGHPYPASDIPKQGRELYFRNGIRLIPDARSTPAPILSANDPRNNEPLDLSHSLIRSVSPTHLEFLANMGVVASMSLPIIIAGRLWGLIACHHRTPRYLPHRLRIACELFAQMASAKLETKLAAQEFEAQLKSKSIHEELVGRMSREADLEAERQRIARELHDSLGQTLTLLQLGLDELGHSLPESEKFGLQIEGLKRLANSLCSEVNRLAWEIRPPALDDLGLETAIRQRIETWSERLNLQFDVRLALNDRRLEPAVATTLYRVLQEAITNIARHAEATRVAVLLDANEKDVSMIVEDNGRGFSANEAISDDKLPKRLGLLGIRERLSLVAGTLEVESAPGRGCTLYIRVPL